MDAGTLTLIVWGMVIAMFAITVISIAGAVRSTDRQDAKIRSLFVMNGTVTLTKDLPIDEFVMVPAQTTGTIKQIYNRPRYPRDGAPRLTAVVRFGLVEVAMNWDDFRGYLLA